MMFVKSLLPISIGDLGIREAGSILFLFNIWHFTSRRFKCLVNAFFNQYINPKYIRNVLYTTSRNFKIYTRTILEKNKTTIQ